MSIFMTPKASLQFQSDRSLTPRGSNRGSGAPAPETHDDLRIIDSRMVLEKGVVKYLLYHIAVKENGKVHPMWKAVKFTRITRVPLDFKRSTQISDIHRDVLTGLWHAGVCTVTLITNAGVHDSSLGVIFAYGVQATGKDPGEACFNADRDFGGLVGTIEGSFAQVQHRAFNSTEGNWVLSCAENMRELLVVKGIPKPRESSVRTEKSFGLEGDTEMVDSEEQVEEVIRGLHDVSYMMIILGSPIKPKHIARWLSIVSSDYGRVRSEVQGTRSLGASIMFPFGAVASMGDNAGISTSQARSEMYRTSQMEGASEGTNWSDAEGSNAGITMSGSGTQSHNLSQGDSVSEQISRGEQAQIGQGQSIGRDQGLQRGNEFSESFDHSESASEYYGESEGMSSGVSTEQGSSNSARSSVSQMESNGSSWSNSSQEGHGTGSSQSVSTLGADEFGNIGDLDFEPGRNSSGPPLDANEVRDGDIVDRYPEEANRAGDLEWGLGQHKHQLINVDAMADGNPEEIENFMDESNHYEVGERLFDQSQEDVVGYTNLRANKGYDSELLPEGSESLWDTATRNGGMISQQSDSASSSFQHSDTTSVKESLGFGIGEDFRIGVGHDNNWSESHGTNYGDNVSHSFKEMPTASFMERSTESVGTQQSGQSSVGHGTSSDETASVGWKQGDSFSRDASQSERMSAQTGMSEGGGSGYGVSENMGRGVDDSVGTSRGLTQSQMRSMGQGVTTQSGFGTGSTDGASRGSSASTSVGGAASDSQSTSVTDGMGTSAMMGQQITRMAAMSTSVSVIPSISYRESWEFFDESRQNVSQILGTFRDRLMNALQAGGSFVEVFVLTDTVESKHKCKATVKGAFWSMDCFPTPVTIEEPDGSEAAHLLEHAQAFSPCRKKNVGMSSIEPYRYSTFLTSNEQSAYVHMPRCEAPGLSTTAEVMPRMRLVTQSENSKDEIFLGHQINGERLEITDIPFTIPQKRLGHMIVAGMSGSGKTESAKRLLYSLRTTPNPETGKKMRIVVLDWKKSYRALQSCLGEEVAVYSLANNDLNPAHYNPLKVPSGIDPFVWLDTVCEVWAMGMQLGIRGMSITYEHVDKLYRENNVYEHPENSANVDMCDLQKAVQATIDELPRKASSTGGATKDRLQTVANRLFYYREGTNLSKIYGKEGGRSIDEIIDSAPVVVFEAGELDSVNKRFLLSSMAAGIFQFAQASGKPFDPPLCLLFEEAHEILQGAEPGNVLNVKETQFEILFNESRKWGMHLIACLQNPSEIPELILTNTPTIICHRVDNENDMRMLTLKLGRESRYDEVGRDYYRYFAKQPQGWAVVKVGYYDRILDGEPTAVKVQRLSLKSPTDEEILKRG